MSRKMIAVFAVIALTSFAVTNANVAPAQQAEKSQGGSNKQIRNIRTRLENVMQLLNSDRSDYSGHKQKAQEYLEQARQQLLAAEQSVNK